MATPTRAPIPTPFPQRVADFKQRRLPLLVWLVAAAASAWMLAGRGGHFEYLGLAQAMNYEVSASSTGQLATLLVDVYDEVQPGDIVAKLDDTELTARLSRADATIRQLTAEFQAAKLQMLSTSNLDRADWADNLRRFQTDEEERRLATLELRATVEAGEIEATRLGLELKRAASLLDTGLIGEFEYEQIRLRHEQVQARNTDERALLEQTRSEHLTAQARRQQFELGLPAIPSEEPLLGPLRAAIEVESRRLDEIQARRESLVLRSPIAGQVSQVLCRTGQTVVPGETILTITEPAVREIVTYLAEADDRVVRRNEGVLVSSLRRPNQVAESFVVRLGPSMEMKPQRLWRDPSIPDYGRPIVIAALPGLNLTPGELLHVRFDD